MAPRYVIALTESELTLAGLAGVNRRVSSIFGQYRDRSNGRAQDWNTQIDGAAAEMAFAKWSGCYWPAANKNFKAPDLFLDRGLTGLQVRSTTYGNGHLIIRPIDDPKNQKNEPFVLVTADPPNYTVVGWLPAEHGKQQKYWKDDHWRIPQDDLFSVDLLLVPA